MSVLCKSEEIIVDTADYNSDEADDNIRLTLEDSGGESYHHSYSEQNSSPHHQRIQHLSVTHIIPQAGKGSSKSAMENEKRMRREIANSNERRRMQSINAGFQSLRSLLPHHEGEKLSKAAILQQTSQYIIELEREKTHLLSQNSQLKRNQGQHEISGGGGGGGNEITCAAGAIKKRKLTDNVITLQTISDSSDEGLGSMSPEPITLINNVTKTGVTTYISTTTKDIAELKANLEAERKRRMIAEERLRQVSRQIYPNHSFVHRGEVIEHTDNVREEEIAVSIINDPLKLQVVEIDALPAVGQTQVVVCSSLEDMQDDEVVETITEEIIHGEIRDEEVIIKDEIAEYVEVPSRLQPILEAAIKAEPKVEVERINATLTKLKDDGKDGSKQGNGRMYLTSTSRQNLETIVEAIRHLEGDHLFGENPVAEQHKKTTQVAIQQEVPLALTNKPQQRKQLPAELSPFLQLKKQSNVTIGTVTTIPAGAAGLSVSSGVSLANASAKISNSNSSSISSMGTSNNSSNSNITTTVVGSSTLKAQLQQSSTTPSASSATSSSSSSSLSASTQQQHQQSTIPSTSSATTVTISAALKQCRPGVIVAKQISS